MSVRRRVLVLVAVVAATLTSLAPAANASPPDHAQRHATVATYNLYLGGDISTLLAPDVDTLPEFLAAATALWQNVQATDFPSRAQAIADLLSADRPDVVGLQEVANWQTTALAPGVPAPSYDFLSLLLDALAARGTPYRAIAENENFDSPTIPLPSAGVAVHYTDRDVVIARADLPVSQLKAANPMPHTYAARIPITLPFSATPGQSTTTIFIIRGWSTVDVKVRGKTYRVANTHLEAFSGTVRNLQAAELMTSLGTSPYPVVLVGDLNSGPGDLTGAYGLAKAAGFVDSWLTAESTTGDGNTSGQADDLRNFPSAIDHRIDYVLYEPDRTPRVDAVEAHVIGEEPGDRTDTVPPLWPSDHAGVVATLHVAKP